MPRAGLSPDAVVALALELVDEGGPRGFAQLTLSAVAERAGVATPSLYKHVGGLPALRREVARIAVEQFTATLSAAAASTRDPADALRGMAHAVRDQARALPGRYSAVQGSSWVFDPEATAVHAAAGETVAAIAEQLARLGVPESRRIDAVRAFRAAVHGFVALELDGGFGLPDDVDVSFDYLVDGLVDALARTGAATTASQ
ncbi:WHG domain-containing protein [Cellulomonas cellasea]|uniref:TetR/AcrR family transcriptional regulator n=1 Tax=Cellulomonas cellasea TaxID=43670 RepID=UPI0025A319FA|nr:TetR/AcrR family transcriptional regulator [Cellulomonas cellasea]MDM8083199.1 WHG domain-containing protein [Cellulomonas cellasea]